MLSYLKNIIFMKSAEVDSLIKLKKYNLSDEELIKYSFKSYKVDENYIYLPRHSLDDEYEFFDFIDNTVSSGNLNLDFIDKRDDFERSVIQDKIVDEFFTELNRQRKRLHFKDGILVAPMGLGKTIIGAMIAQRINKTTLIVVPDNVILNQWKETIQKFLGYNPGIIKGNIIDIKKITIAIQANLLVKDIVKNYFGCIIYDEVHRLASERNLESLLRFPVKYRIGLTATPRRHDDNFELVKAHFGDILVKANSKEKKQYENIRNKFNNVFYKDTYNIDVSNLLYKPKVYLLDTDINKNLTGSFIKAKVKLSKSKKRNDFIQNMYKKFKDRNVLMVTQFRNHAKILQNRLGGSLFIGGMNLNDLEKAKSDKLVIATYSKVKEGADLKKFDVLFLVIPVKKDNEQVCGRILRRLIGKKDITIFDFVDNDVVVNNKHVFKKFGQKRKKWYESFNYEIL